MDEITIRALHNFNEHWEKQAVPERLKEAIKREKYYDILKYLKEKQIISITGLRRTGKTTIMFQIMDYLIENKTDPKNILYFSFDEISSKNAEIIEEIIRYYTSEITKDDLNVKEKKYFFFDEIQKVDNWQAIIKRYYDLKYNIKFIVSGSESLVIKGKTKESLAGRNYEFSLHPLSFAEYLKFKKVEIEKNNSYEEIYKKLIKKHDVLNALFEEYILKGGFPETIDLDIEKTQTYLKEAIIEKIVFSDIPTYFKITNPEVLIKILEIASNNTSQLFELESICKSLGISRNSASLYIFYLQNSFLLNLSYNYTASKIKQLRTSKKIYVADSGIINAILNKKSIELNDEKGKIVETIIYNELIRNNSISFWRDKVQHEVDIIIKNKKIMPLEIKYSNEILSRDYKNIRFFMEKNKISEGMIITKKEFNIHGKIKLIPAWLFLLKSINS